MAHPESADFLIVGSGIAGLRAAVTLAPLGRTVVLTKASPEAGSTGYAQGGIAAAIGADDSPALHAADTIAAGDGLCDTAAVRLLTGEGAAAVRELVDWGAAFDRGPDGALDLAREAAHAVRRVLHARDATGREIARTLFARLSGAAGVVVRDHATVIELVAEGGRIAGARFLDETGALTEVRAGATLLATGGAGQVFRETTNPPVACGDGVALGWLAGARIADVEFVQFHPTALAVPGHPRYLLTEALRGEGAHLLNAAGERFMTREDPAAELAPRDRVARAIVRESRRTGAPVTLSLRHLPPDVVRARFPHVAGLCARAGLDLARDPLPVSPAAHYLMGGVMTDLDGRTSLPGLFAAGEVACTGVHGANRLASNSLLEGLVFGRRAAEAMRLGPSSPWPDPTTVWTVGRRMTTGEGGVEADRWPEVPVEALRDRMWQDVGVFRDAAGLSGACAMFDEHWRSAAPHADAGPSPTTAAWRGLCALVVSRLIAHGARRRIESRGAHWRADFAGRDDLHWSRRLIQVRGQ